MIARTLATDADVLALCPTGCDGQTYQGFHSGVALIEIGSQQFESRVAIQPQRQLGQVVRANREAIKVLQKGVGEDGVARDLAHHDDLERGRRVGWPALAAAKPMRGQQTGHLARLLQRAHERHHHLYVGQPHVIAHPQQGLAFHRKGFAKISTDVTRGAPKSQHRVFFLRLITAAANQRAVFVAFEVGQAHDHRFRPERRGNRRHTFGHPVHVEGARRGVPTCHRFDRLLQIGVHVGIVEDRLGVHTDIVVDDELEPGQPDATVGQLAEIEGQLRVANVHHDLHGNVWHGAALHLLHFGLEQAVVDETGVALGATHRHQHAVLQTLGCVSTADHRWNAQFPRDDGGVAGAPAPVGDDGRGAFHHRLPIRVCHVGDQNIATLHCVHVADVVYDAHRSGPDLLADGTALHQHGSLALELVAVFGPSLGLALDGLRPRLQDVQATVQAVLTPFDVHGAAIVLLDDQRVTRQGLYVFITQGVPVAQFSGHVGGAHQLATLHPFFFGRELHLQQLGAEIAPDDGAFAGTQHRLVHIKLVRIHRPLHHRLAQPVT